MTKEKILSLIAKGEGVDVEFKESKVFKEINYADELGNREHFRANILNPLIKKGLLKLTIPDKPSSPKQKYVAIKVKNED